MDKVSGKARALRQLLAERGKISDKCVKLLVTS